MDASKCTDFCAGGSGAAGSSRSAARRPGTLVPEVMEGEEPGIVVLVVVEASVAAIADANVDGGTLVEDAVLLGALGVSRTSRPAPCCPVGATEGCARTGGGGGSPSESSSSSISGESITGASPQRRSRGLCYSMLFAHKREEERNATRGRAYNTQNRAPSAHDTHATHKD